MTLSSRRLMTKFDRSTNQFQLNIQEQRFPNLSDGSLKYMKNAREPFNKNKNK